MPPGGTIVEMSPVSLLVIVVVGSLVGSGCGNKASEARPGATIEPAARDAAPAATRTVTPGIPALPDPPRAPEPPATPKLQIQLRSTPSGAESALDGRPSGRTPVTVDVDDDGKEHEFTFVLAGYGLERYRTRPLKSGVIHARLRAVPIDAGP